MLIFKNQLGKLCYSISSLLCAKSENGSLPMKIFQGKFVSVQKCNGHLVWISHENPPQVRRYLFFSMQLLWIYLSHEQVSYTLRFGHPSKLPIPHIPRFFLHRSSQVDPKNAVHQIHLIHRQIECDIYLRHNRIFFAFGCIWVKISLL